MAKFVVKLSDGTTATVEGERYEGGWNAEVGVKTALTVVDESGLQVMMVDPDEYKAIWRKDAVRFRGTRKRKQAETGELAFGDDE